MIQRRHQQNHLLVLLVGVVLGLAQQAHQALSVNQLPFGGLVQIAGKLGKDLHLPVLGQIQTQGARRLFHGLRLSIAAHTGHRQSHIDRGPLAGEEQAALQKDLAVGDGNDIGGDVGRHVAGLGLHDGQRRHAAAAQFLREVGRTLQQTGVQIEHIAGVGLPSGGPLQQQAQRPVGHGVLGEIVIDDQNIPALPHEILAQRCSGIGSDVLQGR